MGRKLQESLGSSPGPHGEGRYTFLLSKGIYTCFLPFKSKCPSLSCFMVSQSRVLVCAARAVWTYLCYLLCDLTSNKVTCRETASPAWIPARNRGWPFRQCAFLTEAVGPLVLPGRSPQQELTSDQWEIPQKLRFQICVLGLIHGAQIPLGSLSCREGSLVPSQLRDSKQLLRNGQFLPVFPRTVKSHFCLTHVP